MTDSLTPAPAGGPQTVGTRGSAKGVKAAKSKMPPWLFRTIVGVVAAVVLVIVYLIASVTVPLMWANSIKDQVGGQLGNSIPLGMFYGFTFTFIPILTAWQAHRSKLPTWLRVSLVAVGVLLTIPNLLTLGLLFGNTQTAADARSIWANTANWFGTWSQVFMVVGVVCAVAVIVFGRMWLRRGKKLRELKAAQKLVRQDEAAQQRANKIHARAAQKAAKEAARTQSSKPGTAPTDSTEV